MRSNPEAGMSPNDQVFYTTNIFGGGIDCLYAIDTSTNTVLGSAHTPFPIPHNLAVTKNKSILVTHSGGASNKVTVYAVSNDSPIPDYVGEVVVGFNPFGLASVPGN